jgi:hypothetical protein
MSTLCNRGYYSNDLGHMEYQKRLDLQQQRPYHMEKCKAKFVSEFKLLLHRAKKYYPVIEQWLEGLALPYVFKALPLAS